MKPDPQVPQSFTRNFLDSNPGYRPGVNEEVDALFNPSISAKPLHVPMAGQIRKRLNSEMEFYWAFDRNGQNPYHERCERLRAVGFEYATTKDVDMYVADTIKGESEIRNGDLRLMKVPKMRWLEIRKSQMLQAIMMMNPKGKVMGENGTIMGAQELVPGVKTTLSDESVESIRSRAIPSSAAADIQEMNAGGKPSGNASVVRPRMPGRGQQ